MRELSVKRDALDGTVNCGDLILTYPGLPLRSGVGATTRAETPSDECIVRPRDDTSATAAVAYNPLLISFRWIIAMNNVCLKLPQGLMVPLECRKDLERGRTTPRRTHVTLAQWKRWEVSQCCLVLLTFGVTLDIFHGHDLS